MECEVTCYESIRISLYVFGKFSDKFHGMLLCWDDDSVGFMEGGEFLD